MRFNKTGIGLLAIIGFVICVQSQNSFPEKCLGKWKGTMLIYKEGNVKDSIKVNLTISKTNEPNVYGWVTKYLSEKYPITKDYKLKLTDTDKRAYILDEGDGIMLKEYGFGNKLYGVFQVDELILTSSYELRDENLIFEVTSGKKMDEEGNVINYSVDNLQRVVFERISTN